MIKNIKDVVWGLLKKGVKKILLFNIPDLSETPFYRKKVKYMQLISNISKMHNNKLQLMVKKIIQTNNTNKKKIDLHIINLYNILDMIINNKENFQKKIGLHFTEVKKTCLYADTVKNKKEILYLNTMLFTGIKNTFSCKLNINSPDVYVTLLGDISKWCSHSYSYLFWDEVHPTAVLHSALFRYIKNDLGIKTINKI